MPDISSTITPNGVIVSNVSGNQTIGAQTFDIGGQRLSGLVDVNLGAATEYSILRKQGNAYVATNALDAVTIGAVAPRAATFTNLTASGTLSLSSNTTWNNISFSYNNANGVSIPFTANSLSLNNILSKLYSAENVAGVAYNNTINLEQSFNDSITSLNDTVATLAPQQSPTFSGIPTAPTPAVDVSTNQIATTAYVTNQGYLKQSAAALSYQPLDVDLTALASLPSTNGLLRKTGVHSYTLDANTYLTANQTITFGGDVSGSGASNVNLTLSNSGVTAGVYNSSTTISTFTVDSKGRISAATEGVTITPAFSNITNKPTTLSEYGITDAQPFNAQLSAISNADIGFGFLKRNTNGHYIFDNNNYLTANQSITFSGDATGSGASNVNLTLSNSGVTAGTYRSVTVDTKGRVTNGTNPTTIAGYGLIDAVSLDGIQTISGQKIFNGEIHVPVPTQTTHAATKAYVDSSLQGLQTKPIVRAATTAVLNATYTNGPNNDGIGSRLTSNVNGILSVDGVNNFQQFQGVLVKNQSNKAENGRYYVFDAGSSTQPYILIRCGLCDVPAEIAGAYIFVAEGNTAASNGYVLSISDVNTFRVGIDPINVIQFSGAGQIVAGTGLVKDGNILNVVGTTDRISITADAVDLATFGTAGTYRSVTVDAYGRVSSGTNPTTIAGYGLTNIVQPYDATLSGIASVTVNSADKILYSTDADSFATTTLSNFGRSLIDDIDADTARSTLGCGTLATQNSSNISISGGAINGTSIGASSASTGAFTTLSASGNFSVDSTTFFVDSTTNKVGIGTDNPQHTLDVVGTVSASSFVRVGGTSSGFLKADGSVDSNVYLTTETDSQSLTWNGTTGALSISNGNSVNLDGRYLQAESDTLNSVTARGATTTNAIAVGALTTTGNVTANNLVYKGGNTEGAALTIGTNDDQNLNFETNGNTRMIITSAGAVGFGVTSIQSGFTFEVAGQSKFANQLYLGSNLRLFGTTPIIAGDNFRFTNSNSVEIMRLSTNGNVGIGTTTPSERLTVSGNISASGTVSGTNLVYNTGDQPIAGIKTFSSTPTINGNAVAVVVDPVRTTLTGNGSLSTFPIGGATNLVNPSALIVAIDGVLQEPVANYTVSGGNITFVSPLPNGSKAVVISPTNVLQTSQMIPSDGTVTSSKLDTNLSLVGNFTVGGQTQFNGATRPTSAGTGTPAATSLITLADADSRYGQFIALYKNTDTVRTAANVYTLDPDLQTPVENNAVYHFEFYASGVTGVNAGISTTGQRLIGPNCSWSQMLYERAGFEADYKPTNLTPLATTGVFAMGASATAISRVTGTFKTSASGTFGFEWGNSSTGGGNSTIEAGSYLILTRIA